MKVKPRKYLSICPTVVYMCRATVLNIYLLGDEVGQRGEGNIIRDFPSNIHECPGQAAKPFTEGSI